MRNQVDTSDSVYIKSLQRKNKQADFTSMLFQTVDRPSGIKKRLLYIGRNVKTIMVLKSLGWYRLCKSWYGYLVQHYELSGTDTCLFYLWTKSRKESKTDYTNLQSELCLYSYIINRLKNLGIYRRFRTWALFQVLL